MNELVQSEDIMDDKEKIIHVIATERDYLKLYLEDLSAKVVEKDNIINAISDERNQYIGYLEELKQYQTWFRRGISVHLCPALVISGNGKI